MDRLRFGTGGIPNSSNPATIEGGIARIRELGLDCMELEFVRSVNVTPAKAPDIRQVALEKNVVLTVHGSYFVNLASKEKRKIRESIERILKAARIGHLCGAVGVTFHAAFFQKRDPSKVFSIVRKGLEEIVGILRAEGNDIWIRPELTGKPTQLGSLDELIELSSQVEGVLPCIDFAHMHARTGRYNTRKEFGSVLERLEKGLGKDILGNMHMHTAGIEYGSKGERNHTNLKDSDLNYEALMQAFKDFNVKGTLICESPNLEEDGLLMKKTFQALR